MDGWCSRCSRIEEQLEGFVTVVEWLSSIGYLMIYGGLMMGYMHVKLRYVPYCRESITTILTDKALYGLQLKSRARASHWCSNHCYWIRFTIRTWWYSIFDTIRYDAANEWSYRAVEGRGRGDECIRTYGEWPVLVISIGGSLWIHRNWRWMNACMHACMNEWMYLLQLLSLKQKVL